MNNKEVFEKLISKVNNTRQNSTWGSLFDTYVCILTILEMKYNN